MWLACYTQEEIAAAEDVAVQTISNRIEGFSKFAHLSKNGKTHAEYLDDFATPVYNIWTNATKTNAVSHFGNSEQIWTDKR